MVVVDASALAVALADDDHDGDLARERLRGEPPRGYSVPRTEPYP